MRTPMQAECAFGCHAVKLCRCHRNVIRAAQMGVSCDDTAHPCDTHVTGRNTLDHAVLADTRWPDNGDEASLCHVWRSGAKWLTSISRSHRRARAASSWKMPTIAAPRALAASIRVMTTSRLAASRLAVGSS